MAESFLSQVDDFTLLDSSNAELNGVVFHNVQSVYTVDEPVKCIYSVTDTVKPENGDLIGLFKVGWVSPSEVYSAVAAKIPSANEEKTFLQTTFSGHQLPNNSNELYQFCYMTQKCIVGASTPFTFETHDYIAVEDPADPGLLVFKSRVSQLKDELLKLSDDRSYYASKYEILNQNFLKLKLEFDKVESELRKEKDNNKLLEEENDALVEQAHELSEKLASNLNVTDEIEGNGHSNGTANNRKWELLYKVFEVAMELNTILKLRSRCPETISFESVIDYILDIITACRREFQLKRSVIRDETQYCLCYFNQKAFCCPKVCNETLFFEIMTQPMYTCFSNVCHWGVDKHAVCDGSFNPHVLIDYINATKAANNTLPLPTEDSLAPLSDDSSSMSECTDNDDLNIFPNDNSLFMKVKEERDNALRELKVSKEKIATLNSRVNVLEIELVAQQSNETGKGIPFYGINKKSSKSVPFNMWETILDRVNTDYIILKEKYNELTKKNANSESIETKCSLLEEENKKLISYFTQIRDKNDDGSEKIHAEIQNLLAEKKIVEDRLTDLQKEAVGKISISLVHQEDQGND